jgi:hypothetical protein
LPGSAAANETRADEQVLKILRGMREQLCRKMHRPQESTAPELPMQIIAGILSVAALMWVEAASAQATYSLSVSRHRDLPAVTEAEVRDILAKASRMLKKDSRHNDEEDVVCDVTFTLNGPVRTFGSRAIRAVVDENNIQAVHRVDSDVAGVDFHVKLVEEIKFCRPELAGVGLFSGCSYSPPDYRSTILVHPKLHKDPSNHPVRNFPDHLLWAHEFGHLTGLGHRHDGSVALMTACPVTVFSRIPDTCVRVNRAECKCLLSGPGKCPLPEPFARCLLPQPVTACQ